jgi:hypothetical protein
MKLRRMRLPENVARVGEMRNAYKVLVGKFKEWRSLLRVCFQWRVLKEILSVLNRAEG